MSPGPSSGAEDIFAAAVPIVNTSERDAYVAHACGANEALRAEVESLLTAHDQSGGFMRTHARLPATALPSAEQPGHRIGPYRLLRKIGEGGFGTVWMAEQEVPIRRRVALKIIKLGMDTRQVVARFEAERQALAMMDHPNIARVFDGGASEGGRPFFVMELVSGLPITTFCDEHRFSTDLRLQLFVDVCQAVQHAHQKGIIHRDLKPSNVLVTEVDGRPVPKVIDFGVAKATEARLTTETLLTQFPQWLGTPVYMSPEQAGLDRLDIDTRSDVYSLGVLLYELLTGRTPFDGQLLARAGYETMLRTIREGEPPKPSTCIRSLTDAERARAGLRRAAEPHRLAPLLQGELDWIIMKALEKDRGRRYETASALAEDLVHHLNGEPVNAAAPSATYRLRKFAQRHTRALLATGLASALLITSTIISLREAIRANQAEAAEADQRHLADRRATESRHRLVAQYVANGVRAQEEHRYGLALLWFVEALKQDDRQGLTQQIHRQRIGSVLQVLPLPSRVWFHDSSVNDVAFAPQGQYVATASTKGILRLWNITSSIPAVECSHPTNVTSIVFSRDGARILTAAADWSLRLWEVTTGRQACPAMEHEGPVVKLALHPDGHRLYTATSPSLASWGSSPNRIRADAGSRVHVWDTDSGNEVCPPLRFPEHVSDLALSPCGRWLAVASQSAVMLWDLQEGTALVLTPRRNRFPQDLEAHELSPLAVSKEAPEQLHPPPREHFKERRPTDIPWFSSLAFHDTGDKLLLGFSNGDTAVWSIVRRTTLHLPIERLHRTPDTRSAVVQAVFSPDGHRILVRRQQSGVSLFAADTGEFLGRLSEPSDGNIFEATLFSPDGLWVFDGASQTIWDARTLQALPPSLAAWGVTCAAFSPDGSHLLVGCADNTARLVPLASGRLAPPILSHEPPQVATRRSADSQPDSPQDLFEQFSLDILRSNPGTVTQAAFSRDGQLLVTGADNGSVRVWSAPAGKPLSPYVELSLPIRSVTVQGEHRLFAAGGSMTLNAQPIGEAQVWEISSGARRLPPIKLPGRVDEVEISPDGRWLILTTSERTQVWDLNQGQPAVLPNVDPQRLRGFAVSPDGRLGAACLADLDATSPANPVPLTIQVFTLVDGQPVGGPIQTSGLQATMLFSPDQRWLLLRILDKDLSIDGFTLWSESHVEVWDLTEGDRKVHIPSGAFLGTFQFTADSSRLLRCGTFLDSREPQAWDLPSATPIDLGNLRALKSYCRALDLAGARVVQDTSDGFSVCDVATGERITPTLGERPSPNRSPYFSFSPHAELVLASCPTGAQLWPVPIDQHPIGVLEALTVLLTGSRIDSSGDLVATITRQEKEVAWRDLQQEGSELFKPSPEHILKWRQRQAARSEQNADWFAAQFHLNHLLLHDPDNDDVRRRLAKARNQLALARLQ